MKKFSMLIAVLVVLPFTVRADENHKKADISSPPFERLSSLVGTWEGTHKTEKGEEKNKVTYELTSAKSALVERFDPGTNHEMMSVYNPDGTSVVMTHYCMLGNQPRMKLSKINENTYVFDYMDGTNMKKSDPHMHSLKVTLLDDKHFKQEWTLFENKKLKGVEVFEYSRLH